MILTEVHLLERRVYRVRPWYVFIPLPAFIFIVPHLPLPCLPLPPTPTPHFRTLHANCSSLTPCQALPHLRTHIRKQHLLPTLASFRHPPSMYSYFWWAFESLSVHEDGKEGDEGAKRECGRGGSEGGQTLGALTYMLTY